MSFALLLPAALGALLALLLPLLIHLARRDQQLPTVFAALRWLRERPKPRRRLRFDERLLLLLRLLLLAALVLWLAKPVLFGAPDATPWTVVAAGVPEGEIARWRDGGGELRWLAPGFPPVSAAAPTGAQPLASLLRELDATLAPAAALTVLVPERLSGLDGAPLRLSRDVDWRVLPGASPGPDAPAADAHWTVRHDEQHQDAVRYLRAAALALRDDDVDAGFDAAPVAAPLPAQASRIAWLAAGDVPAAVLQRAEAGAQLLLASDARIDWPAGNGYVAWRDADGSALVDAAPWGRGRLLRLRQPLRPADMPALLEGDAPRRWQVLFEPPPMPARASAAAAVPQTGVAPWPVAPRDLQPWFAVLIALLALLERWLATATRREARA